MSHVYAHPEAQVAHVAAPQLQRACACGESAGISGKCPECAAREQLGVQPKLSLNRPGDRYEQEADRIADRVVSAREPGTSARTSPLLQRQPEGAEEEDEEEIQTKSAGGPVAGAAVGHAAAAVAGSGRPLSGGERSWFEPRLGRDLSAVRLHDDSGAGAAARGINARAYTLRNHIAFAPGAYDGRSTDSRRLLAHELVHTIQQGHGHAQTGADAALVSRAPAAIQRLLSPIPGGQPVCARPPSPRRLGTAVHTEMQTKFKAGGSERVTELSLPFTDTTVCKAADFDRHEPPTSKGRPDLAIAMQSTSKVTVRLGEIKPYNVNGVSAGAGVMECYEHGVERNSDVCKPGESAIPGREAEALTFCRQLKAFGKEVELGPSILWNPGPVTAAGRAITTVNIGGGLVFYACADKLKEHQKKKKKKEDKKKAKGKGKTAKTASKGAKKGAVTTGGKQVAKGVGKKAVMKGAAKKLIPGAAYVEAAAFAVALLAGATPTFGADGMSAEEALFEIAKNGPPPDVEMSAELEELLKQNPDVLERLRAAAGGAAMSDEAAQAMIDMLEANKDLLDAETLEGIAAMAESSGDARLAKTAAEVRRTLEAIRAGKTPTGAGAGEGEADGGPKTKTEAEAEKEAEPEGEAEEEAEPEGEAKAEAGKGAPAGKAASRAILPEEFKKELKENETLSNLFEEVLDRTRKEGFGEADVDRFRKAVAGLSEDQIKQILEEVAKLPTVEPEATEPKQKALDVLVELAAKLKAGEKLTPEQQQDPSGQPADPAARPSDQPAPPSDPTLSETEKGWAKQGIEYLKERGGKKFEVGVKFAYPKESFAAKLAEIHAAHRSAGDTKPSSYGTLMVGIGYRGEDNVFVGTFGHVSVIGITGQRLALQIVSYKSFIDSKGNPIAEPIMIPEMKKFFADINSKVYDFSKGGTK